MHLEALIFDVDGTLADTERDGHRRAYNEAFAEQGLNWSWSVELYGRLLSISGGEERIGHYIENYRPEQVPPTGLGRFIADLHTIKTRHYVELVRRGGIPARPGIKRLLREARAAGLRLAIATTTSPAAVSALLETSLDPDAASSFEVIGAGDIVAAKKPAPDIYHYVMEKMGLAPEQCIAFEDSENGLQSARAAGLKTIITVNDYTRGQDFPGAAIVVDHLGEEDLPCRVLSAAIPLNGATLLDLALIRRLHAARP